ncbi:uncharacterized protein LOC121384313 [Gigantopelta aegis]|uniref:uncharacterized protein LOC121384313 n=1 Tax=Gigantopelta aegis TaxID=1735272 RepID=UPI001B88AF0C|nr:uncharacterized protein LOC121384313 [Gigantopelta aegis]XP_041370590.1 uncharacterized protein LOC121384313 [Gigantopelta aegis]XP_041370598.1 uncharacterized protein LOC121384313 [Gigantopelta aegis]
MILGALTSIVAGQILRLLWYSRFLFGNLWFRHAFPKDSISAGICFCAVAISFVGHTTLAFVLSYMVPLIWSGTSYNGCILRTLKTEMARCVPNEMTTMLPGTNLTEMARNSHVCADAQTMTLQITCTLSAVKTALGLAALIAIADIPHLAFNRRSFVVFFVDHTFDAALIATMCACIAYFG